MLDLCPPHDFRAGWQTDEHGVIYCRLCGEVRELEAQRIGAPAEEVITVTDKQVGGGS
jgi:Fe2+ or Zn2+ uptake regulation protein